MVSDESCRYNTQFDDWDYSKWPSASEVLLATKNGGLAMREPKLGELKVGAPADLILVD